MLHKLDTRKDRFVFDPFSWERVIQTDAPALLVPNACDAVAGCRGCNHLPRNPQHLLDVLGTDNMCQFIYDCEEQQIAGRFCPRYQISVELPGYYPKLKFESDEAFVYKPEY